MPVITHFPVRCQDIRIAGTDDGIYEDLVLIREFAAAPGDYHHGMTMPVKYRGLLIKDLLNSAYNRGT